MATEPFPSTADLDGVEHCARCTVVEVEPGYLCWQCDAELLHEGRAWCRRCAADGKSAEVEPEPPGRCPSCKTFLKRNEAAVKHGADRWLRRGELPEDLRQRADDFRDQLVGDQGGLESLTAARAALIRQAFTSEVMIQLFTSAVARFGGDSPAGRKSFDRLVSAMDRQHRALTTLGLERRAKEVDPVDVVHRAVEEANRP